MDRCDFVPALSLIDGFPLSIRMSAAIPDQGSRAMKPGCPGWAPDVVRVDTNMPLVASCQHHGLSSLFAVAPDRICSAPSMPQDHRLSADGRDISGQGTVNGARRLVYREPSQVDAKIWNTMRARHLPSADDGLDARRWPTSLIGQRI